MKVPPKVGAVCLNWARTDLCGGRSAMGVSTAIVELRSGGQQFLGSDSNMTAKRPKGCPKGRSFWTLTPITAGSKLGYELRVISQFIGLIFTIGNQHH